MYEGGATFYYFVWSKLTFLPFVGFSADPRVHDFVHSIYSQHIVVLPLDLLSAIAMKVIPLPLERAHIVIRIPRNIATSSFCAEQVALFHSRVSFSGCT